MKLTEQTITISGNSMWPLIKENDRVSFTPLSKGDHHQPLIQGKIYLFTFNNQEKREIVIHRYLGNNGFKGDNYPFTDQKEITLFGVVEGIPSDQTNAKLSSRYTMRASKWQRVLIKSCLILRNSITRIRYRKSFLANDL